MIVQSLNAVLPLFLMGIVGYLFQKYRGIQEMTITQMNAFIFDILYPIQFFNSIYTGGLGIKFRGIFLVVIIGGSLVSFGVSYLAAIIITDRRKRQGVLQQTFFRGNMVVFGTAIAASIFTPEERAFYLLAMAPILLIQNIGMMLGMHFFGTGEDDDFSLTKALRDSILSPQILAIFVGTIASVAELRLPVIMTSTMNDLSGVATPLCLVLVGAGMNIERIDGLDKGLLIKSLVIKILIYPAVTFVFIYFMKLHFVEAFVALLMFSAPPSLSVCVVARKMKWDIQFASMILVFSTAISLVTLTLWMYFLQFVCI